MVGNCTITMSIFLNQLHLCNLSLQTSRLCCNWQLAKTWSDSIYNKCVVDSLLIEDKEKQHKNSSIMPLDDRQPNIITMVLPGRTIKMGFEGDITSETYALLEQHGVFNECYDALMSDDIADVAMAAYDLLTLDTTRRRKKVSKSEVVSDNFRMQGNSAYKMKLNQKALTCYNMALAFAPCNSRALKLAYSNRSAILFTAKQYQACLADIETCFEMDCPADIAGKLEKRKMEARQLHWSENLFKGDNLGENFFKIKRCNPQIPCASADIDVIFESQLPKVIAKNYIETGSLIALERAFVSATDRDNYYCCYFCHKMDLNLFPCDGCVTAMFCSKPCQKQCMEEFHSVECEIADLVCGKEPHSHKLKGVIKLRNMCNSWEELDTLSRSYGLERIKNSSVSEIYDANKPTSMLTYADNRHFLFGAMFNAGLVSAVLLDALQNVKSFLPKSYKEKKLATRTLARIMMVWNFTTVTPMILVNTECEDDLISVHNPTHYGMFPFIGKLKHSCTPNTHAVALNGSLALVAIEPIKAGTELTVSRIVHHLESPVGKEIRVQMMFGFQYTVCKCFVCTAKERDWITLRRNIRLSDAQKRIIKKYYKLKPPCASNVMNLYKFACEAITHFKDIPLSEEYGKVFSMLRHCLMFLQDSKCGNIILDTN